MVFTVVATGALNIAADWIHLIGSWGISHTSLHRRVPPRMPFRDPFAVALISYLGLTPIPRTKTPIPIGYVAIS
eukprot:6213565-Pleurochrysis_carterae.AAC.1